jgi:hypothetical protein
MIRTGGKPPYWTLVQQQREDAGRLGREREDKNAARISKFPISIR